jgi:hypothetical protein
MNQWFFSCHRIHQLWHQLTRSGDILVSLAINFTGWMNPSVDTQKCLFCKVVKMWNRLHHCVPLVETVKNIYGTSNLESGWRSYASERCSVVGIFEPSQDFQPKSGLLTQVRTFGRPNKKACSDLAFWISIQTIPNSWKTWKIRLWKVSYRDKTTSSIYERIMTDWVPIYPIIKNTNLSTHLPYFSLSTSLLFGKSLHEICWHSWWPFWS